MKSINLMQPNPSHRERASTTFLALMMLALLLFIGATVLLNATRLYNGNEKVEGWQEALNAAEAGADLALANLRWSVISGSPAAFSASASPSPGWVKTTTTDPVTHQTNNTIYTYTTPHIKQSGEGTSETWAVVTVDSPIGDNTTSPPSGLTSKGNQWYRIRSTGHARIPGLKRASTDLLSDPNARHSNALRKFSLAFDRTTGATLSVPEATRTIEELVQPKTALVAALLARTQVSIPGNQLIDSYDPTNSNQFNNGLIQFDPSHPDPTKHGTNGNVAVLSSANNALTIGSGEKVYGSAATNGGNFTDPNNTIQSPGTINNSYNISLPAIPTPTWGTGGGNPPINNSITDIEKAATTITISSDPTQNYYKIQNITQAVTVALGTDPNTGKPITSGTLNIWLTGTLNKGTYSGGMTPGGSMTIPKGATVKIYVDNGVSFHPGLNGANVGGIDNQNKDASTLQIYGVGTFPGGNAGAGIDLHVGGSGVQNFYGTVYAPYRYVLMKYDGSTNYDTTSGFYGSFVANYLTTTQGSFHYDESLTGTGTVIDYDRVGYVEDPR
jgi:hypothetical protein